MTGPVKLGIVEDNVALADLLRLADGEKYRRKGTEKSAQQPRAKRAPELAGACQGEIR